MRLLQQVSHPAKLLPILSLNKPNGAAGLMQCWESFCISTHWNTLPLFQICSRPEGGFRLLYEMMHLKKGVTKIVGKLNSVLDAISAFASAANIKFMTSSLFPRPVLQQLWFFGQMNDTYMTAAFATDEHTKTHIAYLCLVMLTKERTKISYAPRSSLACSRTHARAHAKWNARFGEV